MILDKDLSETKAYKLTQLSLFFSIIICLLKFLAYYFTKSVAIYSDAVESIINIFSALLAYIGTKLALKPSDKEHPYGHTKVEYLISFAESIFILLASISIFWKAIENITTKKGPENLGLGLIIVILATIINLQMSYILYKQGRREGSPILISHATHLFTDVITTIGVILGIIIVHFSKLWFIDPIIGILVSLNILYLGYKILKDSINSLLDVSLSKEKIEEIIQIIYEITEKRYDNQIIIKNFKSRKAGRKSFVEFDLLVPGYITVQDAHDLCDEIEKKIQSKYPEISVSIHVEPLESL